MSQGANQFFHDIINADNYVDTGIANAPIIVKTDIQNGFCSIKIDAVINALKKYPELSHLIAPVARGLLQPRQITYRSADGTINTLTIHNGLLQGTVLSPALFSITVLDVLKETQALFPTVDIVSYLDDVLFTGNATQALSAMQYFDIAINKLGLALAPNKTEIIANKIYWEGRDEANPPIITVNDISYSINKFRKSSIR
jgi:hypothetical protein